MKLTKNKLKQLIKEELRKVLRSRRRLDEAVDAEALLLQHVEDQLKPVKEAIKLLARAMKVLINQADHTASKRGKAHPLASALEKVPSWLQPWN